MRALVATLLVLAGLTSGKALCAQEPQTEPTEKPLAASDLVGSYIIVASEKSGEPTPKERIDGMLVKITEKAFVTTDTENKEVFAATYTLDATKSPTSIELTSTTPAFAGTKAPGLIGFDGENLRLIYKLPDGDAAPTKFATQKGQVMVVLKKAKASPSPTK